MPPMMGQQAVSPSPFGALAGGDAPQDGQQPLQDLMGKIRDLATQANDIVQSSPSLQPFGQQLNAVIKQMIVAAARSAPQQTSSAADVPPGA